MKITTIGIDLAKSVFQSHWVNGHGKPLLRKQIKRSEMATFFSNIPPCLIGMEACGGAHYWARKLIDQGHTIKLMAPQFVKPYVKTNKNDAADAEAICEAVARPTMRFVAIKNVHQQAVLAMYRARQGLVRSSTAQANQVRGLFAEFGLVIPQGIANLYKQVPALLEEAKDELPGMFRELVLRLLTHLKELDMQVGEMEVQIQAWHRSNALSRKLEKVPGIGPLTASALVASIGDAKSFENGRHLASWLDWYQAALQWWQADVAGNKQKGRLLLANFAYSWSKSGYLCSIAQTIQYRMACKSLGTARQECRRCRVGEQERKNRVGTLRARSGGTKQKVVSCEGCSPPIA